MTKMSVPVLLTVTFPGVVGSGEAIGVSKIGVEKLNV
jgi:hypothetical protein